MTTQHAPQPSRLASPVPSVSPLRSFLEWFGGIMGAIAAFMGAFILLASDTQSVGLWGDASWEVGEISAWWGIGLLAVGIIAVLGVVTSVVRRRR